MFENTAADASGLASFPRLPAAIVVGLGDEGRLRSSELVYAVRTGIVAWAERQSRLPSPPGRFDLAATLIGSSSGEVSVSHSAQMIVQAARAANEQLATQGWPRLGHLQLVELFHDRACEAWRALRLQPDAAVERVGSVGALPGSLRRSLSGYRGVTHDSLTALLNSPSGAPPGDELTIAYTLDSQMSRGPLRATQTASALLRSLVATASNQPRPDAALAGTLYRLLVPSEFDAYLAGSAEMVLTLDAATAAFPWEMVGLPGAAESAARPLAVRSKLLRKLRIAEFRAQLPNPGAADNVLVIGAPLCDPAIYPPLPGARAEAEAVLRTLTQAGTGLSTERVRALTKGASAAVVIQALFERPYRVLHLAGHASPGAPGTPAGIVLSGGHVLSAAEFEAMGVVPELVVVSCGHLPPADSSVTPYDRTAFAASLAEELLRIGVRCVVATGWVVESAPALQFASAFHAALRAGERFIDAVGAARGAAWRADPSGVTWGAYQCYGDPDWTWRRAVPDAPALTLPPGDAFAYIEWHGSASPAGERAELALDEEYADIAGPPDLALVLETIATRVMGAAAIPRRQIDRLRYLEARHAADWGQIGAVGEAFGLAWAQTGELDAAIAWYARAVDAADGTASFRAAELAASLLARRGTLQSAAPAARQDIRSAIAQLSALIALRSTVERQSLLGSAYKRLAMVENRAGQGAAEQRALARTAEHYGAADALAEDGSSFYPAKNALDAELRLAILQGRRPTWGPARVARVTRSLHRAVAESPDFWSVVCLIELQLLQAIAQRNLAPAVTGLTASFQDLKTRVPSSAMWDSVFQGARFTLEPYHAVARGTERRAAAGMLAVLASMAGTE